MALKVLGVPKSNGKGTYKEEGTPSAPSDKISATNKKVLPSANKKLKKFRGEGFESEEAKNEHMAMMSRKNREKTKQRREDKATELEELQQAGIIPEGDNALGLATEDRRREVYKLHLRGFTQAVMADLFGVTRMTIINDLKIMKKKIIDELTNLGAEGLVTKSYSMYELLQHETIKYLDNLPDGAIKDGIALIRLAKDLEDSKTRLLSTIGAIRPSMVKGAESITHGNTSGAPIVHTDAMVGVLDKIRKRMEAATAEDAEVSDDS